MAARHRFKARFGRLGRGVDILERLGYPSRRHSSVDGFNELLSLYLIPDNLGRAGRTSAIGLPEDAEFFSAAPEALLVSPDVQVAPAVRETLTEVSDGRSFSPHSSARIQSSSGKLRSLVAGPSLWSPPHSVSPRASADALVCIRRKARRGVLLAMGRGGGSHRKPRSNSRSGVWC